MIAITGATGHLGQATIQALLTQVPASEIIAVVRDPQKAAALQAQGVQVRPGDYNDQASLTAAFAGADKVLLISTVETELELRRQQHLNAIEAAKQAGVAHLIYTSVVNPSAESPFVASPGHAATEADLRASGLSYTIFRNTLYLDLLPGLIGESTLPSGKYHSAAGKGKVSYALRSEIGEALANAMTSSGHENQVYDIAPAPAYSMRDVAQTLSEVSGQPVEYVAISNDDLKAALRQHHLPEPVVELLAGMTQAMEQDEFNLDSPAFEQLLGRKPTNLQQFLASVYGK
ncbi:SDR family oxidoreductase [Hymenobacter sp. ASUV-10]|uniref:SDR family oxidoreductase n=1 Tax=Hymenobacter aranciens TaxID=3063996 RepID=A0ABT9B854_9BACT|nr:SDR family oxidoreductase [Hymenobacter sp. ASUV-10]MDO7874454.1 SDR family oxidoreductase [Hymenobacter sp. ASUV-10]